MPRTQRTGQLPSLLGMILSLPWPGQVVLGVLEWCKFKSQRVEQHSWRGLSWLQDRAVSVSQQHSTRKNCSVFYFSNKSAKLERVGSEREIRGRETGQERRKEAKDTTHAAVFNPGSCLVHLQKY